MKTNALLTFVIVLQALLQLGQWTGGNYIQPAHAQIPDAGAQRNAMIEELRSLNAKTDKLIGLLESGNVQVKVAKADEK